MKTQTDVKALAKKVTKMFDSKKRSDGAAFYCLKDSAPEWVKEMVHEAHGDMMPDDQKYDFIVEALYALSETDDSDEIQLEPDIYNSDLLKWISSNLTRSYYVNEAFAEFGINGKDFDLFQALSQGQYMEKQEVLGIVKQALVDHSEEVA